MTDAVVAQVHEGTTFTLMHPKEVILAERLVEVIPCAERVRFAKNGADATGGAIRAARALTGREHIIATGYHGYHDWYIATTERDAGVPVLHRELSHAVPFNDLAALEAALSEFEPAAVIMELPGREPGEGYLQAAIDVTHRHGALFVLDEIVTGFRYALGGAQEYYGILPDLACFGKGMANGYPLAAVVGSAAAMEAFEDIFFSMTYSGETVSLAAALATLDVIESEPVLGHIWERGEQLRAGLLALGQHVSFGVTLLGNPPRSAVTFDGGSPDGSLGLRALFLQECHRRGVLFGVPMFPTYSHSEADIERTLAVVQVAFEKMEAAYNNDDIAGKLEGTPPGGVFRSHA